MFHFNSYHPINPATGLPMNGDGMGGVDVGGSPYGVDVHHPWSSDGTGLDGL